MRHLLSLLLLLSSYLLVAVVVLLLEVAAWWATVHFYLEANRLSAEAGATSRTLGTVALVAAIALVPAAYLVGLQVPIRGIAEAFRAALQPQKEDSNDPIQPQDIV